jgi:ankyrin repeat protein
MKIRPPDHYFSGAQLTIARALLAGDAEAVFRLAPGEDLDRPGREDMTLLFFAIQSSFGEKPGQLGALSALVRAGADPLRETPNMGTPLGVALRAQQSDYVRAFLDAGVSPDTRIGSTPILFSAATHHTKDTMDLLLARGADVRARDGLGANVLHEVLNTLQLDLIGPLLDAGADAKGFNVLGVSFAYALELTLRDYSNDPKTHSKCEQIRDRIVAMGVQWPPLDPPTQRDRMRSQGMKVVVPAGHER